MPTGRREERGGWRSGIRHALFKVCAAYISDRQKMLSHVCCGNRTAGNIFDAQGTTKQLRALWRAEWLEDWLHYNLRAHTVYDGATFANETAVGNGIR